MRTLCYKPMLKLVEWADMEYFQAFAGKCVNEGARRVPAVDVEHVFHHAGRDELQARERSIFKVK